MKKSKTKTEHDDITEEIRIQKIETNRQKYATEKFKKNTP